MLLPELENGLSDSSYRIRLSSVELTGDLLFQITGILGKDELTEDQNLNKTLVEVLGQNVVTEFWHCCLFAVPMLLVLLETLLLIFGRRWLQNTQELSRKFCRAYCYCC